MIRSRGTAEKAKEETRSFARRKGVSSGKTSDGPVDNPESVCSKQSLKSLGCFPFGKRAMKKKGVSGICIRNKFT